MNLGDFVKAGSIPEQQRENGHKFPLVLEPSKETTLAETLEWISNHRIELNQAMDTYAVILFRNFPLKSPQDFLDFLNAFNWKYGTYSGGGGPRKVVVGPIHTSTESPPDHDIKMHHELAYITNNPSKLAFWCEHPAAEQGETPVLLSHRLIAEIERTNPQFLRKVQDKKIRYIRTISDRANSKNEYQRCWQDVFETEDRKKVEEVAKRTGHEKVEWLANGGVKVVSKPLEAVRIDPRTNKPTWFNSIILLHHASYGGTKETYQEHWETVYGDYSEIDDNDVKSVCAAMEKEKVAFKWQQGDAMIVDNMLALHGRHPFTPPRRVLAAVFE